jgi:hypothetical protein
LINDIPGHVPTVEVIGDPQSAQKFLWTRFPLSPKSLNVFGQPLIEIVSVGTPIMIEKDDPDCFWQFVQWHTAVRNGSASPEYRILPQRHPPSIFGIECFPPVEPRLVTLASD